MGSAEVSRLPSDRDLAYLDQPCKLLSSHNPSSVWQELHSPWLHPGLPRDLE